jgi:hypothetical protein
LCARVYAFFSSFVDFLAFAPVFHTLTLFDFALTHYVIFESVLAAATGGVGTKSRRALEKGGGAKEFRLQRQGEQLAPTPLLPSLPAMLLSGQALQNLSFVFKKKEAVLRIRIRIRIHMFLGLPDPDPLVRCMDPDPDPALDQDPDPSIIMQK